jgi:hypothetical protein
MFTDVKAKLVDSSQTIIGFKDDGGAFKSIEVKQNEDGSRYSVEATNMAEEEFNALPDSMDQATNDSTIVLPMQNILDLLTGLKEAVRW